MTGIRRAARVVLVAVVLQLAGCAVVEREPAEPEATPSGEPPETVPDAPRAPSTEAAVRDLMADAGDASEEGDHERAGALLERALRIQPDNAVLWHNLAIVRYRQDDFEQAESMALRSVSHVGGNTELERRNWKIIAVSRHLRGDDEGAEEARQRAQGLQETGVE